MVFTEQLLLSSQIAEIAPVRVNFIEAGFVGGAASLAVRLMVNTAITGATYSRG